jgi:cytochrome c-type biogenesis protein CcmH/NrfG
VGNYVEMSTARLTWVVLDRLVPPDDEATARAALIARDPELQSLVTQGILTEDQAIATIRAREPRHRDPDQSTIWATPGAALVIAPLLVAVVLGLLL